MKKYLTLPVLVSVGNLLVAGFSAATGHMDTAQLFFGLFVGQWFKSAHESVKS